MANHRSDRDVWDDVGLGAVRAILGLMVGELIVRQEHPGRGRHRGELGLGLEGQN